MSRGGKRVGAGRKPRLKLYNKPNLPEGERQESILSWHATEMGQLCEAMWRKAWGERWKGQKRPRERQRIIHDVALKFHEEDWAVELAWKNYRSLEADLRADLDGDKSV